jgi:hypothetical protein
VHLPDHVLDHVPEAEHVSTRAGGEHVAEQVPIMRDLARAEAMAAYTRSILEPLVTRLAEQEATIRGQAETIGTLRAEVTTLKATQTLPASNLTPASLDLLSGPFTRTSWVYGAATLLALVAVVVLLTGPRYPAVPSRLAPPIRCPWYVIKSSKLTL